MGGGKYLVLGFLIARVSWAAVALDLGVYATHLEDRFYLPQEFRTKGSHVTGLFRLRSNFGLGRSWRIEPSLGFLFPWHGGADGNVKNFTAHFDLGISRPLLSFLILRAGPGVEWMGISSSGEAVELNNGGADQTRTFYTPGKFSWGYLFTLNGALVIQFSDRISLSFEMYFLDVASQLRRSIDGVVALGVKI